MRQRDCRFAGLLEVLMLLPLTMSSLINADSPMPHNSQVELLFTKFAPSMEMIILQLLDPASIVLHRDPQLTELALSLRHVVKKMLIVNLKKRKQR